MLLCAYISLGWHGPSRFHFWDHFLWQLPRKYYWSATKLCDFCFSLMRRWIQVQNNHSSSSEKHACQILVADTVLLTTQYKAQGSNLRKLCHHTIWKLQYVIFGSCHCRGKWCELWRCTLPCHVCRPLACQQTLLLLSGGLLLPFRLQVLPRHLYHNLPLLGRRPVLQGRSLSLPSWLLQVCPLALLALQAATASTPWTVLFFAHHHHFFPLPNTLLFSAVQEWEGRWWFLSPFFHMHTVIMHTLYNFHRPVGCAAGSHLTDYHFSLSPSLRQPVKFPG